MNTPEITLTIAKYLTTSVRSSLAGEPLGRVARRRITRLLGVLCVFSITSITPLQADQKDLLKTYKYKEFAALLVDDYKQMRCLDKLWMIESKWSPTANNKSSTAFGIPQLLKLTEVNPYRQIVLGIKYLDHRYKGDICRALTTLQIKGYY
jgi:hypothetical protein